MITNEQIQDIISRIADNYYPEKIILIGSYARGDYSRDSDLDLILIKNTDIPRQKRGIEIRRLFYGVKIPMDFKIYTQEEFIKELENQYSFLSSALKDSRVLYERND